MRKMFQSLVLIATLPIILSAKSYLISSLPLPKTYIQNIDEYSCDLICLDDMLKNGEIFSFLAHIEELNSEDESLFQEDVMIYSALFNLGGAKQEQSIKIALLLPSKIIGRYAYTITNSVFAYLLAKNRNFTLKSFEILDEESDTLEEALHTIRDEGFNYTIAALTSKGAKNILALNPKEHIFIPTINLNTLDTPSSAYIYFGGIDYKKQIEKFMYKSQDKLVVFYSQSQLGYLLNQYTQEEFIKIYPDSTDKIYPMAINKKTSSLKNRLEKNPKIEWASFVLNTPIVKTGMILSQMTLNDINNTNILSTQINYDPIIFSMTQYNDRKNLFIANSITEENRVIIEANSLLNNDIEYDWINYATTIGVDYFFHLMSLEPREYTIPFVNQQLNYPISLVQAGYSKFQVIKE